MNKRDREMKLGERIFCLKLSLQLLKQGKMQFFHREAKKLITDEIERLKKS